MCHPSCCTMYMKVRQPICEYPADFLGDSVAEATSTAVKAIACVEQGIRSGQVPNIDATWHALDMPLSAHCRHTVCGPLKICI